MQQYPSVHWIIRLAACHYMKVAPVAFSAVFWHWPVAEKMEVEIACGICWSVAPKCSQGLVAVAVLCEALCQGWCRLVGHLRPRLDAAMPQRFHPTCTWLCCIRCRFLRCPGYSPQDLPNNEFGEAEGVTCVADLTYESEVGSRDGLLRSQNHETC